MNQPLNNYFVNSSHNTYLMGIQVTGEATVEGYINAIKLGARLLERKFIVTKSNSKQFCGTINTSENNNYEQVVDRKYG